MLNTLVTFPLQVVCQLMVAGNSSNGMINPIAVDTRPPQQTTALPYGYFAFTDIGVAYKYFNYKRTWNLARKDCIKEGGSLAVINSPEKIEHAMRICEGAHLHVGAHRRFDYTEWTSVSTGSPVTVTPLVPWPGSPEEQKNWLCLAMWHDGRGLTAGHCDTQRNFICEIPLPVS